MNKRTIRHLLKWSHAVNVVLLILVIIDYALQGSQAMAILLGTYGVFLIWLVILLLLDARPPWMRVTFEDEPQERRTITYGRR